MSADCGCCAPTASLTPLTIVNRAGLSAIAYRIGTYSSFRETMLEGIATAPELAGLRTREDDDYAVTILDLWSAVGDVLTFYQERYANEAFLRTATQRQSIGRLARLIDYSLRPGVAALAWLAFTVDDEKAFHAPARLRVQSVAGQNELPQTFETIEEIDADARFNRVRVLPAPYGVNPLAAGSTEALVSPGADGLAATAAIVAGSRVIVYAAGAAGNVEELTVAARRIEEDRITLAWTGPVTGSWAAGAPLSVRGRTFKLFGHTAPESSMQPTADASVPGGIAWSLAQTDYGLPASSVLALDARIDGLATGTRLLVDDAAGATAAVVVTKVSSGPAALGALTDTVTRLTVEPGVSTIGDLRDVTVYELTGAPIPLWGYAYPARLTGGTLMAGGRRATDGTIEIGRTIVAGRYTAGATVAPADLPVGRTVLVGDAETDPVDATVEAVTICGASATVAPTAVDATTARELGLGASAAAPVSGAIGAPLVTLPLSSPAPRLLVDIGSGPARMVPLPVGLSTAEGVRAAFESALQAATPAPEFAAARVHLLGARLLVFAGVPGLDVEFLTEATDATTVRELGLDRRLVVPARGLASAPVADPPPLSAAAPEIDVTLGPVGPRTVPVTASASLAALASDLQARLRQADPAPGFAGALVLASGERLIVLPGPVGTEVAEYLRIDLALARPLDLDMATAYALGNVAASSHGETVRGEKVGDGDASAAFQRFSLKKKPLTDTPSGAPGGLVSSLQVTVDGVLWNQAPGMFGASPEDRVYATRIEDDGSTVIQFGDGRTGAQLPTGSGNVAATYRVGAGVAGRVRAAMLTTALDRPPGLKAVSNPLAAHGGADPERPDDARANAPTTVRTFGRAVSLDDFADLVRDSRQVAKAQAIWAWDGFDRTVHLTVAGPQAGVFTDDDLRLLGSSLAAASQPGTRLRLANYVPLPILLSGTLNVAPDHARASVLAAVRAALAAALGFDALSLGEPVHLSEMYRAIQAVPGVVSADLTEFDPKRPADRDRPNVDRVNGTPAPLQPHIRVLPARPDPAHPGAVLPAELATVEAPDTDLVLSAEGGLDA